MDELLNLTKSCSDCNATSEVYRRKFSANMVGVFFTILICVTAIVGNLAVVFASAWNDVLRSQTSNILIVYLSITDVMTAILVMIPSAVSVAIDRWPLDKVCCRFHAGLSYMFACSSGFNIALISIDRALAVLKPLQYPTLVTTKVTMYMCLFLFILGCSLALPTIVLDWTTYDYAEGVCAFDWKLESVNEITNYACVFCSYIPAMIIGICNSLIILAANSSKKQKLFVRRKDVDGPEALSCDDNMRKTIKSMIILVVTYYICHSPYAVLKHLKASLGMNIPPWLSYLITIMIFVSSATNPFIYGILRKDYRNAYKRVPQILAQKIFRTY